jgi:hypothetical protein
MTQSFGQKAVGKTFNPSGQNTVDILKQQCADFIDSCNNLRNSSDNADVKRMLSVAITECQTAQMWAVKAVTWSDE